MPITLPTIIQKVVLDTKGFNASARKIQSDLDATSKAADQTRQSLSRAMGSSSRDFDEVGRSSRQLSKDLDSAQKSMRPLSHNAELTARVLRPLGRDADNASNSMRRFGNDSDRTAKAVGGLGRPVRDALTGMRAFSVTLKLLYFPAILAGIGLLAQALGALSAAAIGLVSSLGPLVGALGALPGAFSAVIAGALATVISFGGIKEAFKAGSEADTKAAETAKTNAKARSTAARGVEDATRGLADAEESAARSVESATERVRNAKERLVDAQKAARTAQESLTFARKRASEQLEDMQFAAEGGAISEQRAVLRLAEARQRLAASAGDPNMNNLDRANAVLDLKEAELGLREAQDRRVDTQEALNEGIAKGIDGSDEVVAANERIAETQRAAVDAQKDLAQSQIELSRAQRDGARSVADAQRNLSDALAANTEAMAEAGKAADKYAEAMKKLSPAGQSFVRTLLELKPQLEDIKKAGQDALFPGMERGLRNLVPLFPLFSQMVADSAGAVGNLIEKASQMIASPAFAGDLAVISKNNAENLTLMGEAGLHLGSAMRGLLLAADPMLKWMLNLVKAAAGQVDAFSNSAEGAEKMRRFFDSARAAMTTWGHIIRDFGAGLFNIFKAAKPLGDDLAASIENIAAKFRAMTGTDKAQAGMTKWFLEQRPVITELSLIVRDLALGVFDLMNPKGANTLLPFLKEVRAQIPAVFEIIKSIDKAFTPQLTEALVQLFHAFANLSGTSGPLMFYIKGLTLLLKAFNGLMEIAPFLKPIIFFAITLSAASRAFNVMGFTKGIKDLGAASKGTAGFVGGLGDAFGRVHRNAAGELVPATGIMAKFGRKTGEAFKSLGGKAVEGVKTLATNLGILRSSTAATTVATQAATTANVGFTASLLANPITLIVAGLIALGVAVYAAYQHFEPFRKVVDATWQALQVGWDWVMSNWKLIGSTILLGLMIAFPPFGVLVVASTLLFKALKAVWSWISDNWGMITGWFKGPADLVAGIFRGMGDNLSPLWNMLKGVWNWLANSWARIVDFFRGPANEVGGIFDGMVEKIKGPIDTIMGIVKSFAGGIGRILTTIGGPLKPVGDALQRFAGWKDEKTPGKAAGGAIPAAKQGMVSANSYRNAKRAEVGAGFKTGTPRAIVGEGSRHPEFVIPTDPKYRDRAMGLFSELGKQIGALAGGGAFRGKGASGSWGPRRRTLYGAGPLRPGERRVVPGPLYGAGPLLPGQRRVIPGPLYGAGPLLPGQRRVIPEPLYGAGPLLPGQRRMTPEEMAARNRHTHGRRPARSRPARPVRGHRGRRVGVGRRSGGPAGGGRSAVGGGAGSSAVGGGAAPAQAVAEQVAAAVAPMGTGFFAPANTMATINSRDIRYWLTHLDEFNSGHGESAEERRKKDIALGPVPAYREPFPVRAAGGLIPAYGVGDWIKDRVKEGVETGKAIGSTAIDVGKIAAGTAIDVAKGAYRLSPGDMLAAVRKGGSRGIEALWPKFNIGTPAGLTDLPAGALNAARQGVLDLVKGGEDAASTGRGWVPGGGGAYAGALVDIGRKLQSQGFRVSEHPAFGGVRGRHSPNSYHYRGRAIDVNFGPGGTSDIEKAAMDRIAPALRSAPGVKELLWRTKGHFDHLHMAMAQGGVNLGDTRGAVADLQARIEASVRSVPSNDTAAIAQALKELRAPQTSSDSGRSGPLIDKVYMAPNSSHDQFAKSLSWELR